MSDFPINIEERIRLIRRVQTLVHSHDFRWYWKVSTTRQQEDFIIYFNSCNESAMQRWLEYHPQRPYSDYPISRLKLLASAKGIKNWSRLTKEQLTQELDNHEQSAADGRH